MPFDPSNITSTQCGGGWGQGGNPKCPAHIWVTGRDDLYSISQAQALLTHFWASGGWILESLKELSWFQHPVLSLGSGRQLQPSFMSGLSHKHYLMLLCLRVGPTSGAKIACLSVSPPPGCCERGGSRRQCSETLSQLWHWFVRGRRREDCRYQGSRKEEQVAEENGHAPFGKGISEIRWIQLHIEADVGTSEILWFIHSFCPRLPDFTLSPFILHWNRAMENTPTKWKFAPWP